MLRLCAVLCLALSTFSVKAATVQYAARKDVATGAKALRGLAIGDFNRDGKLDIAVTDAYTLTVTVYLGDGTGNFGQALTTVLNLPKSAGLGPLLVGDVNEDGILDLIEAPVGGSGTDVVLFGKGDGTFQQSSTSLPVLSDTNGILIDMNGDGHLDIIGEENPGLGIALGDGKGNFTAVNLDDGSFANGAYSFAGIAAGDLNRDNHLDLIAGIAGANTLRFFAANGDGTFKSPTDTKTPAYYPAGSLATADFDGDGRLDLVVGAPIIASIAFGNGDGTFQVGTGQINVLALPQSATPANSTFAPAVATTDMDGDGTPDIVVSDYSTNLVSVFLNTDGKGTFLQTKPDFSAPTGGSSLLFRIGDVNGDGLPDILLASQTTGAVQVFVSIPPPKSTPAIAFGTTPALVIAGQSTTVTLKVTGSGQIPSGQVALLDGNTPAGQHSLDGSGAATFNLNALVAGQHAITANYAGDKLYNGISSAFTLTATDFAVAATAPTQTVLAGGTASYSVAITPNGPFSGTVAFTCSGLPAGYACSVSSTSLNGTPTTAVLTISTNRSQQKSFFTSAAACTLGLIALTVVFRRGKYSGALLMFALACTFAATEGCSSGGSATSGSGSPGTGTSTPSTPVTTNFTVTATGTQGSQTVAHTFQATLIVQ